MNEISNLIKNTNGLTDKLYSAGNNLRNITEDTVKKSCEGKEYIEEMVEIIKSLENENRNNTEGINEVLYGITPTLLKMLATPLYRKI